MRQNLTSVNIY